MDKVIRGTTPTIKFTFHDVDVNDITQAYLTIQQNNVTLVEKTISYATVEEDNSLSWRLEQAETLRFALGQAKAMLNWLLEDGTRGASCEVCMSFIDNQKDEVIT